MVEDTAPSFLQLPDKESSPQGTRMGTQPAASAASTAQGIQGKVGPDLGAEKYSVNGTTSEFVSPDIYQLYDLSQML